MQKHWFILFVIMVMAMGSYLVLGMNEESFDFAASNPIDKDYEKELELLSNSREYSTASHIELEGKYVRLWDVELNVIYKKLLSVLEMEEQEMLKESQRAWLKYHEKERDFFFKTFYERKSGPLKGTLGRIEAITNYRERIRRRTIELMEYYSEFGTVEFVYKK